MKFYAVLKKLYLTVALSFVPCLSTLFLHIYASDGWWEMGMVLVAALILLYVLPFYLVYLEIGAAVGRRMDGKVRSAGERQLGCATTAVATLLAFAAILFILQFHGHIPGWITAVYWPAYIALPVLWSIGAVVYKKRLPIREWLRDKGILIPSLMLVFLALALGVAVLCMNLSGGFHPGGKPDPQG